MSEQRNLLTAKATTTGYTWTLTTRLGHILQCAEDRYGPRDKSYTILGIEFQANGPRIWYPGNCRHIAIQLSLDCLHDEVRACYQLAHECIHLLSPVRGQEATLLEEGLATYFSREYIRENLGVEWSSSGSEKYDSACAYVEELLQMDPQIISYLRETQPILSHIQCERICVLYPQFSPSQAEQLGKRFIEFV